MIFPALQDWMFRKEAEAEPGTTCLATVRAVVKMFELRKVVDFTPGAGHSQPGRQLAGIPERIMSDFIDDLIPGRDKQAALSNSSTLAARMLKQPLPSYVDASIGFQACSSAEVPRMGIFWPRALALRLLKRSARMCRRSCFHRQCAVCHRPVGP